MSTHEIVRGWHAGDEPVLTRARPLHDNTDVGYNQAKVLIEYSYAIR